MPGPAPMTAQERLGEARGGPWGRDSILEALSSHQGSGAGRPLHRSQGTRSRPVKAGGSRMPSGRELRCGSFQVVGGPMALVASVQRLAPVLSTVLTSERPGLRIQRHGAGEPASHPAGPSELRHLFSASVTSTPSPAFARAVLSLRCPLSLDLLADSNLSFRTLLEPQLLQEASCGVSSPDSHFLLLPTPHTQTHLFAFVVVTTDLLPPEAS